MDLQAATVYTNTMPSVNQNVNLYKGWFKDSIPEYLKDHKKQLEDILFLHIDCDIYSSTKTIFNLLGHKIVKGTIIVFDEYFAYHGWEKHEFAAFQEFINKNNLNYEYLAYNVNAMQVAVVIK